MYIYICIYIFNRNKIGGSELVKRHVLPVSTVVLFKGVFQV